MTAFLLVFDRSEQRLVQCIEYPQERRQDAEDARYAAEVDSLQGDAGRCEIVILEADSIDELKQTHGSYFPETLPVAV